MAMEGSAHDVIKGSDVAGSALEEEEVIVVRPALLSDYSAVVDINHEIYNGLDYVPSIYYSYFHLPRYCAFVVEVNKLVVSFVVFEISEDGSTATAMANRVRPSHQGRGLSSEKNDDIVRCLTSQHPRVVNQLYTTRLYPQSMAKVNKSEIFYHWNFICFKMPGERADILRFGLSTPPDLETGSNVRELSYTESLKLLESGDLELFLSAFSKRYVLFGSNWRPVPLDKSGLKLLLLNCTTLISEGIPYEEINTNYRSGDEYSDCKGSSTLNTTRKDNSSDIPKSKDRMATLNSKDSACDTSKRKIEAFSFSSVTKCREISFSDVYFYGNNENLLLRQVLMHIKHALSVSESNYSLILHFPQSVEYKKIEEAISEILQVPRNTNLTFSSHEAVLGIKPM